MGWLLVNFFGIIVANIVFAAVLLIGLFIFLQFIWQEIPKKEKEEKPTFTVNRPDRRKFKSKRNRIRKKQQKNQNQHHQKYLYLKKAEKTTDRKKQKLKNQLQTKMIIFCLRWIC